MRSSRTSFASLAGALALLLAACGGSASVSGSSGGASVAASAAGASSAAAKPAASGAASSPAANQAAGKVIASASGGSGLKVRAGLSVATTFDYLPAYAGIDWGTFKDAGVDVELSTFNGDAFLAQAMAAGSEDVGMHSAIGVSNAIAKGSPVKIVAQINDSPAFMGVVAAPAVKTVDDLKGKAVGCTSAGSFTCFLIGKLSQSKGWTGGDAMKPTLLGGFDTQLAALKTKQDAAFIWTADEGAQVQLDGNGTFLMNFGSLLPKFPFETIAAQDKFIQSNPDAMKKFLIGYFKAQQMMLADPKRTEDLAKKYLGLGAQATDKSIEADKSILEPDGKIDPEGMANVAQGMVDLKLTPDKVDPTSLYTTQFTPVQVP